MYCSFFGLQEKPFSVTPDPRFLFLSQSHQEALGHLLYGIEERKGFIAVTGEVGTGKTVVCRALLERLGPHVRTALVFNSFLSELELLRAINEDFGIATHGSSKKELIDELNHFLIEGFREGRNAVVIIDEAQNLAPAVLEQIRMLSNLETAGGKLLQIILVGQPELRAQLNRPDLRQLNQRIAVRYHLSPLDRHATVDYIKHRLLVAGSHGGVRFTSSALNRIYRESQGIPRRINLLCDRALLTAYVRSTTDIDRRIVRLASAELEGGKIPRRHTGEIALSRRPSAIGGGAAVGVILVLGGALWLGYLPQTLLESTMRALTAVSDAARSRQSDHGISVSPPSTEGPQLVATDEPPPPLTPPPEPEKTPHTLTQIAGGHVRLRALLWEYTRMSRQGEQREKAGLADVAATFGLEVLPFWIDLTRLKHFRVASVVETYTPETQEPTFFIPHASSPDELELIDALGNIRRLTDTEFMRVWFGRVYLFYPSGTMWKTVLSKGKRGPEVQTLQQQLYDSGYLAVPATGLFDGETDEAVRRFQRDHYLQVDGAVGSATKILLYQLSGRSLLEAVH